MVYDVRLFYMERKNKKIIKKVKKYVWSKWWNQTLTVVLFLIILIAVTGQVYAFVYKDKIYPGVVVGSFPVGGLTLSEAEKTIESSIDNLRESGLSFVFRDRTVRVPMVSAATEDPDLSYKIISYDIPSTILEIAEYGKAGNFFDNWEQRISGIFMRVNIEPHYSWRTGKVIEILKENLNSLERPAKDATLVIKNGIAEINQEKDGITFNYQQAITEAQTQLDLLIFTPIHLKLKRDIPKLKTEQAQALLPKAKEFVKKIGITISFEENMSWYWPSSALNNLLEIRLREKDNVPEIGVSKERLEEMLEPIINTINIEPQEPRFALEESRVVEFKTSENGRSVDMNETWEEWEKLLMDLGEDEKKFEPIVKVVEPQQRISDVNDLGITELLGVGKSNFSGSTRNRRHNIKIGADSVNGSIIPPGEEFSLLKALGTIDGTTGYLTELVIKGNETIPEYGGGLCQIGTTTFRGTLAAGLPVTMRRPHSYTVSYYFDEDGKPGKDATIYDPWPDFKFKNDTQNHVLILTRIEGDDLFFEYWGTKDGRIIEESEVSIWDRVAPPETKYIETLDLKVDETKCTEYPHAGIKASFDYIVTYPDGEVKEETFRSNYQPWQEVCLIGVEELSEEAEDAIEEEEELQNQ